MPFTLPYTKDFKASVWRYKITEDKIKEIYNVSFNIIAVPEKDRCPMHDWYDVLINKTYSQLDLFDVTRMLIQKMFLELEVSKSITFIKDNPFCGQRYEGELMELLSKVDVDYLNVYKDDIQEILSKALIENEAYEWLCEEERDAYSKLINAFQKKLIAK